MLLLAVMSVLICHGDSDLVHLYFFSEDIGFSFGSVMITKNLAAI